MQKRREGVSCSLQPLFPNTRTEISIYVPNVRRYTCEETNGVRLMMTPTSLPFQFFFFFFPLSTYVSHRIIITAIPSLTFNLFVTLPSPSIYCFVCFSRAPSMCYVAGACICNITHTFPSTSSLFLPLLIYFCSMLSSIPILFTPNYSLFFFFIIIIWVPNITDL